ncbi:hypothetical protein Bbelb_018650 [Branchiostoma belcheri]|nr:hypothetical protein Bbelb_018650 [Branchiostoma belcheri]
MTITSFKECDGSEVPRTVYYRPIVGGVQLSPRVRRLNMFYFGFMPKYMQNMVHARKPLKAAERTANKTTATTQPPLNYRPLRRAWNSWARRLSISRLPVCIFQVFCCPLCGEEPSVIICDGTAIGFRRDFLAAMEVPEESTQDGRPSVAGSKHADRVFIKSKQARELLLRYSGEIRGQRAGNKNGLSDGEVKTLVSLLGKEGHT